MIGTIIGDIVGSRFETEKAENHEFELFGDGCHFTDDTVLVLAVAKAIKDCEGNYASLQSKTVEYMRQFVKKYPRAGYGGKFSVWANSETPEPYNSCGNGAAMRVCAVGLISETPEQVKDLTYKVTSITHNHPEGLRGAEATAMCVYLAHKGATKQEIYDCINQNYYQLNKNYSQIKAVYTPSPLCQGTVPQAVVCFLESESYEDAIRNAVALGGDSDTLAAITGAISEAFYGVPKDLRKKGLSYLDEELKQILIETENYISAINRVGELD